MSRQVIHVSDAEAASDFSSLLDHVRAGAEVVIEHDARAVAVLKAATPGPGRLISESIALAEKHENETGHAPVLDPEFANDMKDVVNERKPWNPPNWD